MLDASRRNHYGELGIVQNMHASWMAVEYRQLFSVVGPGYAHKGR